MNNMYLFVVVIVVCVIGYVNAFQCRISSSSSNMNHRSSSISMTNSNNNDIIGKKVISSMMSLLLISSPIVLNPPNTIITNIANADVRAQMKRTYFRFVPKLITGLNYYKNDLKTAVDKEDWAAINKFFEVYVSKYNANDPKQVDSTDTYVNAQLFRPMTVFAGSFAEKGTSPKQKALMEQEVAFEAAMTQLQGCASVTKGSGFFASDIPASKDKKVAKKAYEDGKKALNEYLTIVNTGLMLELNKIDTI